MKIFILGLTFISSFCSAQNITIPHLPGSTNTLKDTIRGKRFFISANAGVGIPLSDYVYRNVTNNFATSSDSLRAKGFANYGFHFDFSAGACITKHLGLAVTMSGDNNSFDQNDFNSTLSGSGTQYENWSYTFHGGYSVRQYLGGIFGNFQLTTYSSLWLTGMIGLVTANYPSYTATYSSLTFIGNLKNTQGLAYSFHVGYEETIIRRLGFIINLSYTASQLSYPSFSYSYMYAGYTIYSHTQTTPVTMVFEILQFTGGLIFHF